MPEQPNTAVHPTAVEELADDAPGVVTDVEDLAKGTPTQEEIDAGVRDLEELERVVPAVVKETKAGYKTTEFWLTLAGLAAVNLNGVVLTLPDKYQAIASAVLAGLYALSRGQAKKGIPSVEEA